LHALHCPHVNLHSHRLLDKLDRENQPVLVLAADQYPLEALQGTALDSNPVSAFQERRGFNAHGSRKDLTYRIYLRIGNDSGQAPEGHQAVDTRRRQNAEPPIESPPQEQIAGEKRERDLPGSIAPIPNCGVQREEDFKSFAG
jgi:hypothetical protein